MMRRSTPPSTPAAPSGPQVPEVEGKEIKQEWEYEVVSDMGKDLKARLNELGAEGWMLTATEPAFIFRRPRKLEPERFRGPVGFAR